MMNDMIAQMTRNVLVCTYLIAIKRVVILGCLQRSSCDLGDKISLGFQLAVASEESRSLS